MKIFSVYKVINKKNKDKPYIGFDSNWPRRKIVHKSESFNEKLIAYNYLFHKAIRKYGWDAFEWELIYQSKNGKHCLEIMEPHFIKEYNTRCIEGFGYNMTSGGEGSFGYIFSEEQKRKMSEQRKGKKRSLETRKRMLLAQKGRRGISPSYEHRKKLSIANTITGKYANIIYQEKRQEL